MTEEIEVESRRGNKTLARQLLRDKCPRCGEILDRLERMEKALREIAELAPLRKEPINFLGAAVCIAEEALMQN